MQIQSRFPEAFRLLTNPRFCSVEGGFRDQQTGQIHPLHGLVMEPESWQVVGWLLNWLDLSHSRPDVALRVPLIVLEGPPMCGKSWLLDELVKIVGCTGIGFPGPEFPPSPARLDALAKSPYPLWVFDHPQVLPMRTEWQQDIFRERAGGLERFLSAELWQTALKEQYVLRKVMVVTGWSVDLPTDLVRRAVTIRLGKRGRENQPVGGWLQ